MASKLQFIYAMSELLLCSNNPMLVKGLYGVLRDEGYTIEVVDHPAHAVRTTFKHKYDAVIFDSESIGLSSEEAAQIIRTFYPDMPIIIAGDTKFSTDAVLVEKPIDLESMKKIIRNIHYKGGNCETERNYY